MEDPVHCIFRPPDALVTSVMLPLRPLCGPFPSMGTPAMHPPSNLSIPGSKSKCIELLRSENNYYVLQNGCSGRLNVNHLIIDYSEQLSTPAMLSLLQCINGLPSIDMVSAARESDDVDTFCALLANNPTLTSIYIESYFTVTDAILQVIGDRCPQLQHLRIINEKGVFTDVGLGHQ